MLTVSVDSAPWKAACVWTYRTRAELDAAARFARLADRLSGVGAKSVVVEMVRQAACDEVRHAKLCTELTAHFGAPTPPSKVAKPVEVAPSGLVQRERVLYELVAMSCVTETLSAAILGEMMEQARDPQVHRTVHEILRDEVRHSQVGWAHLAAEHKNGFGGVIGDYLPVMLEGAITEELFRAGEDAGDGLTGYGALNRENRWALFIETMRQIVFPGLERFGVDISAGEQWIRHKLAM
jgi:ferritin-like protein